MRMKPNKDTRSPEQLKAQRARFEEGVGKAVADRKLTVSEMKDICNEFRAFTEYVDWSFDLVFLSGLKATAPEKLSDAQRAASTADVLAWMKDKHPNLVRLLELGGGARVDVDLVTDTFGRLDVPSAALDAKRRPGDTVDGKPVDPKSRH
jgi:hypothetical protein